MSHLQLARAEYPTPECAVRSTRCQWSDHDRIAAMRCRGSVGRKTLAIAGLFSYNDKCLLLFEQVTKREGGEARNNLVGRLCRALFVRYIFPNMFGAFCASTCIFFVNSNDRLWVLRRGAPRRGAVAVLWHVLWRESPFLEDRSVGDRSQRHRRSRAAERAGISQSGARLVGGNEGTCGGLAARPS